MDTSEGNDGSIDAAGIGEVADVDVQGGIGAQESEGADSLEAKKQAVESVEETMARVAKKVELDKKKEVVNNSSDTPDLVEDGSEKKEADSDEENDIPAPGYLNKEELAAWEELPLSAKETLTRVTSRLDAAASRASHRAQQLERELDSRQSSAGIDSDIVDPIKQWYPDADAKEVIQNYLEFDHLARTSPFHALTRLAQSIGKQPGEFMDDYDDWVEARGYMHAPPKLQREKAQTDPKVLQELDHLRGMVVGNQRNVLSTQLKQWAAQKDASGELQRPFFKSLESEVTRRMAGMVQQGHPADFETLQAAYDAEAWASEGTRRQLIAKQQDAQRKELQKKATAARRSESSLQSSSPGRTSNRAVNPFETVEQTMARVRARQTS
jgi:hypothetical protein